MYPKTMHALRCFMAAAVLTGGAAAVGAQAPDNTKVNQRDRAANTPTADGASNKKSDRELMQEIRKAIVGDDSLSTYAKNVKVVAKNGKVTLRGPVRSAEEKTTVVAKAREVAGEANVTDQLSVKPEKDKSSK
jgi:osmotically-inducible protein OsmY